jgi:hypothetical protein
VIIIAASFFAIDNETVSVIVVVAIFITGTIWWSSFTADRDSLGKVTACHSIEANLSKQGIFRNAQEQPAQELNPGDLACPCDEWTEWTDRESEVPTGTEPFSVVLAVGVRDDGRLLVGLSNQKGSIAPARTGNWKYRMRSWQPKLGSYDEKAYRIAGAVTDLVEIAPSVDAQAEQPYPGLVDSVTQYLKIWSAAEALRALLIAQELALIKKVLTSPGIIVTLTAVLSIARSPLPDALAMSKMLTLTRLTELGALWRDAGRPARLREARARVLQWLVEGNANAENPLDLDKYPTLGRAAGDHFLSRKDLTSALYGLRQAEYLRLRENGKSLLTIFNGEGYAGA